MTTETTENTTLETTPTEQVAETTQEVQQPQSEQPATTPEATPEQQVQEVAQPQTPVTEEPLKPFELPVAREEVTQQEPDVEITPDVVVELFKDKKEVLLKALGLDDFALGALDYYQKTGSLAEYAEVKSVDYTKVPDQEIVARKLREQYAAHNLSEEELNLLVEDELQTRFKLDEEVYAERDVQLGKIRLKAEAQEYRKTLIDRQAQFRAPEKVQEATVQTPAAPTREQIVAQHREELLQQKPAQEFLQSKIIKLGDFNYEVDNPQDALSIIYDDHRFLYETSLKNEKGEVLMQDGKPVRDTAALMEIAAFARDRKGFVNKLIDYGKTLGKKAVYDEAENVQGAQSYGPVKGPDDPMTGLVNKILQMGA